jgi:peptidase C13-like protein
LALHASAAAVTLALRKIRRSRGAEQVMHSLSNRLLSLAIAAGLVLASAAAARAAEVERANATPVQQVERLSRGSVDADRVLAAQQRLLAASLSGLAAARPGIVDLYFVAFAGTSTQDVFMKEVRSAQVLFDRRFDTRGRSLLLVNNPATVAELPVASVANLQAVLAGVAGKMNVEEDILFLYLTSHGGKHVFSVSFPQLGLADLSDRELKDMLDQSGIKWRVVVISACYSGSFIDALKDDRTLILTAAAATRTSFGCGNENDFTYFGDAYINAALRRDRSFVSAFEAARRIIAQRERAENLVPSQPQIYLGKAIKAKLQQLEQRLAKSPLAAAP